MPLIVDKTKMRQIENLSAFLIFLGCVVFIVSILVMIWTNQIPVAVKAMLTSIVVTAVSGFVYGVVSE